MTEIYSEARTIYSMFERDRRGRDRMELPLPVQSVPITIKVVNYNTAHGGVYNTRGIALCDKVCQ